MPFFPKGHVSRQPRPSCWHFFLHTHLRGETAEDVEAELRGTTTLEPLMREIAMQADAHRHTLLPQINAKHRTQQTPRELLAVQKREDEKKWKLTKTEGVERRSRYFGPIVQPRIALVAEVG